MAESRDTDYKLSPERMLRITTRRSLRGELLSTATVYDSSQPGILSHAYGVTSKFIGDFSRRLLATMPARVTQARIDAQHAQVTTEAVVANLKAEVASYYEAQALRQKREREEVVQAESQAMQEWRQPPEPIYPLSF